MSTISRPKGSQNASTIAKNEIERLQLKVNELEKQYNSYDKVVSAFTEGCVLELKENIKTIDINTLQTWFNNPDIYMENISNLLTYYYIIDGNIFQLYDMLFSLPQLDYKITCFEKTKTYEKDMVKIQQVLKQVKHKQLTRELLIQLSKDGTLIGTWLGNASKPYYYTFDNLKYIYPYGRFKGEMTGVIDLEWIKNMKEEERESVYNNLSPLVTKSKFESWQSEVDADKKKKKQYIFLPNDKSLVARTHYLSRNQRLGIPFGTEALFDLQHKNKMKELERSVANKIIRSIAILNFKGKDDNGVPVKSEVKTNVFKTVKRVLEDNQQKDSSLSVIGLPDFASFSMPEMSGSDKILSEDKYKTVNSDITVSTGVSNALTNGTGGNFASSKINLDIIYKKIGVLLEQIEEIYNQLIILVLGEKKGYNYTFSYNKETPLEKQKRIDILSKLQMQGFSTSYLLDELGIDSDNYYKQSIYEIEELKLRDKILPPMSSYTMSKKDDGVGRPINDDSNNDATIQDKTNGSSTAPKADV